MSCARSENAHVGSTALVGGSPFRFEALSKTNGKGST